MVLINKGPPTPVISNKTALSSLNTIDELQSVDQGEINLERE